MFWGDRVFEMSLFLFLLTDLIKRLEEENKVNVYLCEEKLPKVIITWRILQGDLNDLTIDYYNCFMNWKELEGKKKYARDLQNVADEPAMGQNDVDELNKRVRYS